MSYGAEMYDEDRWGKRFAVCAEAPRRKRHKQTPYEQILDEQAEEQAVQNNECTVVTIRAMPFIKTMWALFWTTFRHPFTNTVVDLTTGNIIPQPKRIRRYN